MRKNSIIIIVATLMMLSSLAVGLEASAANNSSWFQASPQVLPGSTDVGNVTIYANGTVSNTSAVQQVGNTNTYNLLVNVNGTLSVERNNTLLNGNGLTINGKQKTAVASSNVTGLTIENLVIVNSSYGIQFLNVQNAVINDVTVNNTAAFSMTMVQVYYSGNVTIENSTFILGTTATSTYAIDAEYGSNINVSYNSFAGATNEYYVYANEMGQLYAWGNSIESTTINDGVAFYIESGGSALIVNNYINATNEGVYVYAESTATTINNFINNTQDPFIIDYTGSFNSFNDAAPNSNQPLYLDYVGNAVVQNANYTNSTTSIAVYQTGANLNDITYNSTISHYGIYVEYGSYLNLYNSNIKVNNTVGTIYGVYALYDPGWVNLVNDNITSSYYGLYLEYAPLFNVTGSQINATGYGIYSDNYANTGSTISGNTFLVPYNGEAMYLYADDVYNTYVGNNRILSSNTSWGSYGINVYADYMISNITIANNYILNNNAPIYVFSDEYGSNLSIKNNTIVNSSDAIYVEDFAYSVVSGNIITNTTSTAIDIYSDEGNANISNNFIENLPGFGGMNYGVYLYYAYAGNNIISHNTVINVASSGGTAVYVTGSTSVFVFSNKIVNGGEYGFDFYYNYPIVAFGNTVTNADYGIYSYENYNFSYYSNTITNSNYSFYSDSDYGGVVYANTFLDTQSNNSGLYFIYIDSTSGPLRFYHNNFINGTFNSTTLNYFYVSNPVFMNQLLPVGGNYYSNYTGTGANGIGSTPVNFTGSIQDLYPLLNKWTSPTVTFLENGLPSGTSWAVKLGGLLQKGTGSSVVFQQTNGQYTTESYSVMNVAGYTASVTSGSLNLAGASNVVTINFTPVTYSVTFQESGLANSTSWSVTLNGNTKTTTGTSLSFDVANGTYSFTTGPVSGYSPATASGSVTVSGAAKSVSVQYSTIIYNLTVREQGLASGDSWTVTIGNSSYTSTNSSVVVQLPVGTYNVTVTGPHGYTAILPSSNVTVSSADQSFNVTFSKGSGVNPAVLYGGVGAGVFFGGAAGALATMFVTGSGIFRKPEE